MQSAVHVSQEGSCEGIISHFVLSAVLVVGVAGSAGGEQRTAPTAAPATMDDLLNELRALRTELRESSAAGLRAQLLVARLQLQEPGACRRNCSRLQRKIQAMPPHVPQRENLNASPVQLDDVFLLRKREMVATCELWTHAFGWECRLYAGDDMIATQVCRSDREIESFGQTWREALTVKGWS